VTDHLTELTKGVYIISATPFFDDGAIDYNSADSLVEFYIDKGLAGITILGMMGEASKMTADEAEQFMRYMMKRIDGRVPVVVGISDPGINSLARLAKSSMDAGAAGVMVAPMSGLKTEENIYNYFAQAFQAMGPDIPVCYQDYPQATNVFTSADCFNSMVRDYDQLVMFKHEDSPGLVKLSRIRQTAEQDDSLRRVSILVGNGGLYLPEELARGADGAMTGFAFPEMLVEVVDLFAAGKVEKAKDVFDAYLPIVRYEQQPGFGLATRKEVLRRRGAMTNAATRAPGSKVSAYDHDELSGILTRLENRLKDMN
jgi:4-hydroxy-tetrahydrodipicolinate synthase